MAIATRYDADKKSFTIKAKQVTPPTPDQSSKEAVLIPLAIGLLDDQGREIPLKLWGS